MRRDTAKNLTVLVAIPLALTLLIPLAAAAPAAAEEELPLRFNANVIAATGQVPGGGSRSTTLQINIREWSTDEEREQILTEVQESTSQRPRNQNRAVARALRGASRIGTINVTGGQSWSLRFSRQFPLENGGRRILLATDRPVSFAEQLSATSIGDFDVTVIELMLDENNEGEGSLSLGTAVRWNAETEKLEVTNVSTAPLRLGSVRPR
jgi:hypothetical protein